MVWWAIGVPLGLALLILIIRMITYKPAAPNRGDRAKIFAEALATLRAGKKYHLKNSVIFDGNSEKLRFFAEALSGQLHHRVMFDEISFGTCGEVVFSTGEEEEE